MIRKSDKNQGYLIICDLCGSSSETHLQNFLEVVKSIVDSGGEVRQEARRTGSGYGKAFWRNYCSKCSKIEGIYR